MAAEEPWEQISRYFTVASAVDFFNKHFLDFSSIGQHGRETGSTLSQVARQEIIIIMSCIQAVNLAS